MTDRLIVVEAPAPTRAISVTDENGELQLTVQVGARAVGVHNDAGITATDLLALGDERWLPNTYEPPAADWDTLANIPDDLVYDADLAGEATARSGADTTLQAHIDAEATARGAADTALQAAIDAEATTRAAAVTAEAVARAAAIASAIAALINSAPGLMDTLKEIADALGDDPNFAATMTTALATKATVASLTTETNARIAGDSTEATARANGDAAVTALIPDSYTKTASDARYQTPQTTVAGYGFTADFNSKGDARWLKQTGGNVYDGTNNGNTITFQVGTGSTTQNAAKFWGVVWLGNNNDKLINSTNSGFLHIGSSGGTTIGYANGTVILKAVTAGVTLSAPLIIPAGAPPASATAAGVAGQWAWDSGFIYICVAANTWKRVAVATWP